MTYLSESNFRYRGKKSPDSVLAEICWWSKNLFKDQEKMNKDINENGDNLESDAEMLHTLDSNSKDESDDTQNLQLPSTSKRPRTI